MTHVTSDSTCPLLLLKELLNNPRNCLGRRLHILITRGRETKPKEPISLGRGEELLVRGETEEGAGGGVGGGGRGAEFGLWNRKGQRARKRERGRATYAREHGSRSDQDVLFGDLLPEESEEGVGRVLWVGGVGGEMDAEPDCEGARERGALALR